MVVGRPARSWAPVLLWAAFVVLLVVAATRRDKHRPPACPALPVGVIGLHGLLAVTTLMLVLLTALGAGG
jgi:hypothetical protein